MNQELKLEIEEAILDQESRKKLIELGNKHVVQVINKYVKLCKPKKVTVLTDTQEDIKYARDLATKNKEENKLKIEDDL